jgi:hypothetical protein
MKVKTNIKAGRGRRNDDGAVDGVHQHRGGR